MADAAGLNVMTVSNALNGSRPVAPATRERVKQIARELNYTPNSAAQALATGRTGFIAVMCGSVHEWYYANMVAYIGKCLDADHYKLILVRRPLELRELLSTTGVATIDGAIAIDMVSSIDAEALVAPSDYRLTAPCISIGTYAWAFIDSVVIDLSAGVTLALDVMLATGRQRIAYIVTHPHLASPEETRTKAYIASMERVGRAPEIINVDTGNLTEVEPELKAYIQQNGCPDAFLCQNDEVAMSVYRVMRDLGRRIPDEVAIVGCDGQLHMKYFDPPLSTVVQPMEDICRVAWKFLKKRIADPTLPHQQTVFEGELVIRDSLVARGSKAAPDLERRAVPNESAKDSFYPT